MNGEEGKAAFLREAEAMYEELRAWREAHAEASFDEIADQVTPQRRKLMGVLLNQLSVQQGDGRYAEATCPTCGERMEASGQRSRQVAHPEGDVELERAYHRCPECGRGLFPPGQPASPGDAKLDAADNRGGSTDGGGDTVLSAGGGILQSLDARQLLQEQSAAAGQQVWRQGGAPSGARGASDGAGPQGGQRNQMAVDP